MEAYCIHLRTKNVFSFKVNEIIKSLIQKNSPDVSWVVVVFAAVWAETTYRNVYRKKRKPRLQIHSTYAQMQGTIKDCKKLAMEMWSTKMI